jgi:hypothetical protein
MIINVIWLAIGVGLMIVGARSEGYYSFFAYLIGVIPLATVFGRLVAWLAANSLVDLIYSACGMSADLPPDMAQARAESEKWFRVVRVALTLLLAASLYGLFWGWPALPLLAQMDAKMRAYESLQVVVFLLSAAAWFVFAGLIFLPRLWAKVNDMLARRRARRYFESMGMMEQAKAMEETPDPAGEETRVQESSGTAAQEENLR